MTPRERFISALERKPLTGRVPHFELYYALTMETFGKIHPYQRRYEGAWDQMTEEERQLHRNEMADIFIATAERFEHGAIHVIPNPDTEEENMRLVDLIREKSGDKYAIFFNRDATYWIPEGNELTDFVYRLADQPQKVKVKARRMVNEYLERAQRTARHGGVDGFTMCSDYCFNTAPFLSPNQFSEFITPFLADLIKGYRDLGFYTIKHTDGNIMPILDQLVQANPHALHSLDPQARVDIAEVKRLYGDRICLIGNVNCGILQTGTDQEVIESARYALRSGMPGGGYIFSTSNGIYTGMKPERYELMLSVWRAEGNYAAV